jgi:hypothetical protein
MSHAARLAFASRRFALAVGILGAALLTGAACTPKATTAAPSAAPTSAAASPSPTGKATAEICDAIDPDKNKTFNDFAEKYGVMLGLRIAGAPKAQITEAKAKAQEALRALAADLRKQAALAADATVKASIEESAVKMEASAAKDAFFDKPKTEKEMESALTSEMMGWLTPVMVACG